MKKRFGTIVLCLLLETQYRNNGEGYEPIRMCRLDNTCSRIDSQKSSLEFLLLEPATYLAVLPSFWRVLNVLFRCHHVTHSCVWAMRDTRLVISSWFYCKRYIKQAIRYDNAMPGVSAGASVNKTCLMLTEVYNSAILVLQYNTNILHYECKNDGCTLL